MITVSWLTHSKEEKKKQQLFSHLVLVILTSNPAIFVKVLVKVV